MVGLRHGIEIADPVTVVLGYLESWRFEPGDRSSRFVESDLRLANRGGARIAAAEMAAILERRRGIERALRAIPADASLADRVAWPALAELFEGFAGIRGVGLSKATKALHPKRPALVPMLDSVVQTYLRDDDPGPQAPFATRGLELVRAYKRDLDANRVALRAIGGELASRGYELGAVRILDLLIWSAFS